MDVGAAIKQQMLSVLIEALGQPGVAPPSAVRGAGLPLPHPRGEIAPAPALPVGAQISAKVAAATPEGGLVLTVGGRPLRAEIAGEALPAAARLPGATLVLRVDAAGPLPRLALLAVEPAAPPGALDEPAAPPSMPRVAVAAEAVPNRSAQLAAAPAPAPTKPIAAPEAAKPATLDAPALQAALKAAAQAAAPRQGSAAPLFAELAALVERADAPLPRPAAMVAQALLETRLDGERPIAPAALKEAIARAAVPAEALAARAEPAALDARTLLATLRALLPGADRPAAPALPIDAEPPHRDGAVAAMRPPQPQLAAETDSRAIATTLVRETEQAIERTRLHHFASLPEMRAGEPQRQQLSFDLPVAFGPQTALAGFRIEREKRRAKDQQTGVVDAWGVRFAIDADGIGPVHAHLRLTGDAVSVSLWAEEAETKAAFLEALPLLEAALAENALDVLDLTVLGGRPAEQHRPSAGRFLDRNS